LLKSEIFADPEAVERFITRSGLPRRQLELLVRTPDRGSHLALCNQVDIALDSFPYHGTTTTCEALWMGLPVVTLAGRHHAARVGKVLLETVGLGDLVAETGEEYVRLAVTLARDCTRLTHLRQTLRKAVERSALCDGERFTRQLETAYTALLPGLSA
jgi:predicted O-linked N-acetylglucosamine transferase (SPINDLY family)